MDIAAWLDGLGLEQYEEAFRGNHIDRKLLPTLTSDDLREMGITSIGHRKTLLTAIAALPSTADPPPAPVARSAERRQLTVMFVDLVGSTALASRLDPEEMSDLLGAYQSVVLKELARFEGHLARFLGDGALAYFGWPRAQEDAAERAVRTGLAIAAAVGCLTAPTGAALMARVGIATGLVVVGELVGRGAAEEETVVGETPNLAARLQALAPPGAVVIASDTRCLTGGLFDYADLGERRLKGFAARVRAWRVLGEGQAESRFEALRAPGLTHLIGRERELELLLGLWARVKDGAGQVVLLAGEPGIGKSRLARALSEAVTGEPHARLGLYGSPQHRSSPLHPVVAHLHHAAGFGHGDSPGHRLTKLEALVAPTGGGETAAIVPLLAALLEIPTGEHYPPLGLSPQQQRERTLETLVGQVEALAAHQPLLALFEDAHWADPSSLELLGLVAARVRALPALLLITCRPEFVPPWKDKPHVTRLTIERLDPEQSAALAMVVADGRILPAVVIREILVRCDGVPLFLEELTKVVLETGSLRNRDSRHTATGPSPPLAIPTTLRDSLLARLDRLNSEKRIAQVGAVIGREFSYELLATIVPLPKKELLAALDRLASTELIFRFESPSGTNYAFKHALVHEAAYQTLLRRERRELHALITQTLEARFTDLVMVAPEQLAHHALAGELWETAFSAFHNLADRAIARSAWIEALSAACKAQEALVRLPVNEENGRNGIDLHFLKADAEFALGHHDRLRAEIDLALQIAEDIGDRRRSVQGLTRKAISHWMRGELLKNLTCIKRARNMAYVDGEPALRINTTLRYAMACQAHGDYRTTLSPFSEVLQAIPGSRYGDLYGLTILAAVACRVAFARSLGELGDFVEGRALAAEGIAIASEHQHRFTQIYAAREVGVFHLLAGDPEAAISTLEEGHQLAINVHADLLYPATTAALGCALVRVGRRDHGTAMLNEALEAAERIGLLVRRSQTLCWLAEARLEAGDIPAAKRHMTEGLTYARQHHERANEGWLLWIASRIAYSRRSALGHQYAKAALDLADELGLTTLRTWCERVMVEAGECCASSTRPKAMPRRRIAM